MTPRQVDIRWINAAEPGSGQQQGTTPAAAVVASAIAIVAARMAAIINLLINLTSFAAQTARASGHREKPSLEGGVRRESRRMGRTAGRHHAPDPRAELDGGHHG